MRLTAEVALQANRAEVWGAMSTVGGVNKEVAPFVPVNPTRLANHHSSALRPGLRESAD